MKEGDTDTGVLNTEDEVDYPPNNYVYRCVDIFFIVAGIFTYLLDWSFDVLTAYNHWWHGNTVWFSLTVIFIGVPSLVMTAVSFYWYVKDSDNPSVPKASTRRWLIRIMLLLFQLGPILRYIDSLYYGMISRRYWKEGNRKLQVEYFVWMLYEDADCTLLRLFECFMEAAPQLVLQLYILAIAPLAVYGSNWVYVLCIGCFTSLVSLAWGVTSHARGSRFTNHEKNNISLKASVVLLWWHILSIGARVTAMVLFASVFQLMLFVVCFVHWLLMVVWLMARRSLRRVCSSKLGEVTLSFVLGAVYMFSFINEQEEPTRNKYITYYIICGFENTFMVVLWLVYADPSLWYYIPGVVFHFVCFFLGLMMMTIYYTWLHPTLPSAAANLSNGKVLLPSGMEMIPSSSVVEPKVKTEMVQTVKTSLCETVM